MENQVIKLEDMPKIGIFECFLISIKAFFKNLIPFCKMLNPIYHVTFATCIMVVPAFIAGVSPSINPKVMLLIAASSLILGIAYLLYAFWQYLIGMAASSYLAKDILENKEIKPAKDYYSYVKENGKSYAKYWLWTCLFWIIAVIVLFLIMFLVFQKGLYLHASKPLIIFVSIAGGILLWPLSIGLGISYLFWAYGDKQNCLVHITKSIQLCYSDPLRCTGYFLLLGLAVFVITMPVFIALGLFTYFAIIPILNHSVADTKIAETLVSITANILQNFIYYIMTYFTSFMATKFYFNFIKSYNNDTGVEIK